MSDERRRAGVPSTLALPPLVAALCLILALGFEVSEWGHGVARSSFLALMLLVVISAGWDCHLFVPSRRPALLVSCVALLAAPAAVVAIASFGTIHRARIVTSLVVVAVILLLAWSLAAEARDDRSWRPDRLRRMAILLASAVPVLSLASGIVVPKLLDIATTTIEAGRALASGSNPYAIPMDRLALELTGDPRFGGYKYLPLMPLAYYPFVAAFGDVGVLVANALYFVGIVLVVRRLARPLGTPQEAIATVVLVAAPVMSSASLAHGATDVAPTLLVMLGFLLWGRSAFASGLMIGLSMSMKPTPVVFAAMLCLPRRPHLWFHYAAGATIGALPFLYCLIASPPGFVDNVLLFNSVRPPDSTSWQYFVPAPVGRAARYVGLAAWLAATAWCLLAGGDLVARLRVYAFSVLVTLLAAPMVHDNYLVWLLPALALLAASSNEARPTGIAEPGGR